jgi:hypothetical protein
MIIKSQVINIQKIEIQIFAYHFLWDENRA